MFSVLLVILELSKLLESLRAKSQDFLLAYVLGHNRRVGLKVWAFFFFANIYPDWVDWLGCGRNYSAYWCQILSLSMSTFVHIQKYRQCKPVWFHPKAILHFHKWSFSGIFLENIKTTTTNKTDPYFKCLLSPTGYIFLQMCGLEHQED